MLIVEVMKSLLLVLVVCSAALAGDLYQHVQLPLLDAYVDSSVAADPDIPGMGTARYFVSVSLTTQDALASAFGVYLRVRFADGTDHVIQEIVTRTDSGSTPTARRFFVGAQKPVTVVAFYVTRYHPENSDQLVTPNPSR